MPPRERCPVTSAPLAFESCEFATLAVDAVDADKRGAGASSTAGAYEDAGSGNFTIRTERCCRTLLALGTKWQWGAGGECAPWLVCTDCARKALDLRGLQGHEHTPEQPGVKCVAGAFTWVPGPAAKLHTGGQIPCPLCCGVMRTAATAVSSMW